MKARKTIAQYCVDASDKQLSEAYDILFGKDWKKTWSERGRANEMRSIIRGGTMPCIAIEKWAECIDFLRGEAPGGVIISR